MINKKILAICLTLAAIAAVALLVFKVPLRNLLFVAVLLACPLLHVWMMKDGKHQH